MLSVRENFVKFLISTDHSRSKGLFCPNQYRPIVIYKTEVGFQVMLLASWGKPDQVKFNCYNFVTYDMVF